MGSGFWSRPGGLSMLTMALRCSVRRDRYPLGRHRSDLSASRMNRASEGATGERSPASGSHRTPMGNRDRLDTIPHGGRCRSRRTCITSYLVDAAPSFGAALSVLGCIIVSIEFSWTAMAHGKSLKRLTDFPRALERFPHAIVSGDRRQVQEAYLPFPATSCTTCMRGIHWVISPRGALNRHCCG